MDHVPVTCHTRRTPKDQAAERGVTCVCVFEGSRAGRTIVNRLTPSPACYSPAHDYNELSMSREYMFAPDS